MRLGLAFVITAAALALATSALAQGNQQRQSTPQKTAPVQYYVDVATHAMPGMPTGGGFPFPGMGGGQNQNAFGNTAGGSPGRYVDLALFNRNRAGIAATHAIPPTVKLGASLKLVPLARQPRSSDEMPNERPRGRILLYWGCGEAIRQGQPRVIDLATANPAEFGRVFTGRHVGDRGARALVGWPVWPNEQDRRMVPRESSLVGEHQVSGDGVPASLRFAIGAGHDFMPNLDVTARGNLDAAIVLDWRAVSGALGYFANAMAVKGQDWIIWSSSEPPDAGFGLLDYAPPATVERWVRERVVMSAATTSCTIPRAIFAGADGAMSRMIAYGPELNLVHPPRQAAPEWSARVRVKSTAMVLLGAEARGGRSGGGVTPLDVFRGIFR